MNRRRIMYVILWLAATYFSYEQSTLLIFFYQHVQPGATVDLTDVAATYWAEAIAAALMTCYFTWRLLSPRGQIDHEH